MTKLLLSYLLIINGFFRYNAIMCPQSKCGRSSESRCGRPSIVQYQQSTKDGGVCTIRLIRRPSHFRPHISVLRLTSILRSLHFRLILFLFHFCNASGLPRLTRICLCSRYIGERGMRRGVGCGVDESASTAARNYSLQKQK
jgi:hypothetical protein